MTLFDVFIYSDLLGKNVVPEVYAWTFLQWNNALVSASNMLLL